MRTIPTLAAALALPSLAPATVITNHQPVYGGGVPRWSQLWIDPGPNGNDLDGDSVCFADFTLPSQGSINHLEWWGTGACELGFRIQVWPQDPGTIAYQPLGVFYYGGGSTVQPTFTHDYAPAAYSATVGADGITHYVLNLPTTINLAANDSANPRWFLCVIGLTHQAYYTWNWSSSTSTGQTFQFIRGGTSGGGPLFQRLGEARAMDIEGTVQPPPCYANCDASTVAPVLNVADFTCFLQKFATGDPYANCDASATPPTLNVADFTCFLQKFAQGCP